MPGIRVIVMLASLGLMASCGALFGAPDTSATPLKGLASCATSEGEAVICGTVFAADGTTPVVGTEIRQSPVLPTPTTTTTTNLSKVADLSSKGVASATQCVTDNVGKFACAGIPETGEFTFEVSGSGMSFSFTTAVTVGAVTDAYGTTASASGTTTKWLVVQGIYDGVQLLLSQLKGCTLTGNSASPASLTSSEDCTKANLVVVPATTLTTTFDALSSISAFDFIFINAATDASKYATVLQDYVAQGGNVYFSDTADAGLTAAFPDQIIFGDDTETITGKVPAATVDSADLAAFFGASFIEVAFSLPNWQPITSVASGVTTYISGDTSALGGTSAAPITVGWKHGSGGCILYTSYHTDGESKDTDQEEALKYLIQNIDTVCQ